MEKIPIELLLRNHCPLCDEIGNHNNALSRLLEKKYHFLHRSENFALVNDISPVVKGHALLVSNKHFLSFAQIPSELYDEFIMIKKRANLLFFKQYAKYFIFEHGTSIAGSSCGNCIDHAHIHYIPCEIDIIHYLREYSSNEISVIRAESMKDYSKFKGEYLYYENSDGEVVVVKDPPKPLPRQFIRMIVAQEFGLRDWNWRSVILSRSIGDAKWQL